jgi:hypothetical protein
VIFHFGTPVKNYTFATLENQVIVNKKEVYE